MSLLRNRLALTAAVLALSIAAPFILPAFQVELTFLWIMIVFALSWDVMGGQAGYNSFGNIAFFGVGVYTAAITQIGLFHDVGAYTAAAGGETLSFTPLQYFVGLFAGLAAAPIVAIAAAAVLGFALLGLRGHYFAIATLGLGIALGELAAGWAWIGGSSGLQVPVYPGGLTAQHLLFYFLSAGLGIAAFFILRALYATRFGLTAQHLLYYFLSASLGIAAFFILRALYATRFGLVLNAIRDDEGKAEALGLTTKRYKIAGWCIAAGFVGLSGGLMAHIIGFIDPREVAFAGATFGVWMVLMAILGGKGTIWGPVIGAVIFHVTRELFWTYLFAWQNVALGVLIIVVVVFFPTGLLGWVRQRWPRLFALKVVR